MGSVYKRKRHSCGLCKPHKVGWAPKLAHKATQLKREHERETREEQDR